jgi:hypothetical protein
LPSITFQIGFAGEEAVANHFFSNFTNREVPISFAKLPAHAKIEHNL